MALPADLRWLLLSSLPLATFEPAVWQLSDEFWQRWLLQSTKFTLADFATFQTPYLQHPTELIIKMAALAGHTSYAAQNYVPSIMVAAAAIRQNRAEIFADVLKRHPDLTDFDALFGLLLGDQVGDKFLLFLRERPTRKFVDLRFWARAGILPSRAVQRILLQQFPFNKDDQQFLQGFLAGDIQRRGHLVPLRDINHLEKLTEHFFEGYFASGARNLPELLNQLTIGKTSEELTASALVAINFDLQYVGQVTERVEIHMLEALAVHSLSQLSTGQKFPAPRLTILLRRVSDMQVAARELLPLIPSLYEPSGERDLYLAHLQLLVNPGQHYVGNANFQNNLLLLLGRADLLTFSPLSLNLNMNYLFYYPEFLLEKNSGFFEISWLVACWAGFPEIVARRAQALRGYLLQNTIPHGKFLIESIEMFRVPHQRVTEHVGNSYLLQSLYNAGELVILTAAQLSAITGIHIKKKSVVLYAPVTNDIFLSDVTNDYLERTWQNLGVTVLQP